MNAGRTACVCKAAGCANDLGLNATRRDLEQLRHSLEATVRAEIADHRADTTQEFRKVDEQFAKVTEEFRKVDQRIAELAVALAEGLAAVNSRVSEQTRVFIVAMLLMFGATIGVILRTG